MAALKLGKLPDRLPVKLTITITPSLNRALQTYAELYRESYGEAEPVAELIPYMLESFLAGDRTLAKTLRSRHDEALGHPAKSTQRRGRIVQSGQSSTEA